MNLTDFQRQILQGIPATLPLKRGTTKKLITHQREKIF